MTIALPARAKLNLDLKVTGRRADGMHELRSHMVAIDLHDLLEVERADATEVEMSGMPISGERPSSLLAAHSAFEAAAGRSLGARYRLHKRIPPGSGLGGASSDAAAALRALSALFSTDVDLAAVAATVGADVTFFLRGGAALVEGVGERATPEPAAEVWFAIAWPGIELSTALVYAAWDEVGGDGVNELRRAAARVNPGIEKFATSLGEEWQMTGSGSSFFSRHATREGAEAAARRVECWTAVSSTVRTWA